MGKKETSRKKRRSQRIQVVKDVLERLAVGKIDAVSGNYFQGTLHKSISDLERHDDFQSVLPLLETCEVCALGACFLATVSQFNAFPNELVLYSGNLYVDTKKKQPVQTQVAVEYMWRRLRRIFSRTQLGLIESAFELAPMIKGAEPSEWMDAGYPEIFDRAVAFGEKHAGPRKRLRAIMKNILRNNGKFVP